MKLAVRMQLDFGAHHVCIKGKKKIQQQPS